MKAIIAATVLCFASSASAQEMTPVFHNGSRALFTRDKGKVEIRYDIPKRGLSVREGTLLFSGTWDGRGNYSGVAFTFKRGCEPAEYPVTGKDTPDGIVLVGAAPVRDPRGCTVLGSSSTGANARLVFEYEFEFDSGD